MALPKKLQQAITRLARNHPFYCSILYSSKVEVADQSRCGAPIPIAGTDGEYIYFSEWAIEELSVVELETVLAHEILHIAYLHPFRRRKRHPFIWNMATDYVINQQLEDSGEFTFPELDCLLDRKFKEQSAEQVYETIYEDAEKVEVAVLSGEAQKQEGEQSSDSKAPPSGGGGSDDQPDDAEDEDEEPSTDQGEEGDDEGDEDEQQGGDQPEKGEDDDEAEDEGAGEEDEDDKQDSGSQAVVVVGSQGGDPGSARGQSAGQGKGNVIRRSSRPWDWGHCIDATEHLSDAEVKERENELRIKVISAAMHANAIQGLDQGVAEHVLNQHQPFVNWKDQLREFISTTFDKGDYSWATPNRRFIPQGLYMPTLKGQIQNDLLAIYVDTSGSISIKQLDRFQDAINEILAEMKGVHLIVIYCDWEIQGVQELGQDDLPFRLETKGGGGTSFIPPFVYAQDNNIAPMAALYFTDMCCNQYPPFEPPYPVRWVDFAGYHHRHGSVPFGEVISMDSASTTDSR